MDIEKQDEELDVDEQRHDPNREIELFGNRRVPEPPENGTFHKLNGILSDRLGGTK